MRSPITSAPSPRAGRTAGRGVAGGFGLAESEPEVDDAVRAATTALADAGNQVYEVSVPWHLHGPDLGRHRHRGRHPR